MSPQVSVPRRRLPTTSNVTAGQLSLQDRSTRLAATSAASASRWRLACWLRSSSAREQQLFLARPHALELAQPPGLGGRLQIVERRNAQLAVEQGHSLGSDALQPQQVEQRRREVREQLLVDRAGSGLRRSRECAATSLCRCRAIRAAASASRPATGSGLLATMSARVAVCADLERVLALQLEQIGDFAEHPRDGRG